ncbi:MAG TPA: bifunctional 1-(5-phosphoribosyl)-5-((5-phosphoribosylamino)methylideneamino)imidazole-4-carboxamide isomerase/phosphoribosylanthranilate isomerase PriA [Candidatus Yaniella excrementavium]|nr:bifunctional 1-(5-phosphoribosyl)-5-((5-phosphoribosylamino)methylideneamino)imidazole-4-carboxamide isomerase/phosphoribosylanthranilate isomerase PriA [Candidatus Yaniella excrementavium]
MTTPLELLPAVDVQDGKAVRLVQGAYGTATNYGDPFEAAIGWQQAGAEWLHLVDLDAAFGHGNNREIIRRITSELGIKIELSGGLRDDASLDEALAMGATRVNLGTAALENPEWTAQVIKKYGDKIAVGLDVRGEKLATRGWVQEGGNIWDVLEQLETAGCARYVVTDITKDGTLTGPNTELLVQIAEKTGKPVVASGGISTLDDIAKLAGMVDRGIEGAIIGKALYANQFTLEQALQVASGTAVKDV